MCVHLVGHAVDGDGDRQRKRCDVKVRTEKGHHPEKAGRQAERMNMQIKAVVDHWKYTFCKDTFWMCMHALDSSSS